MTLSGGSSFWISLPNQTKFSSRHFSIQRLEVFYRRGKITKTELDYMALQYGSACFTGFIFPYPTAYFTSNPTWFPLSG